MYSCSLVPKILGQNRWSFTCVLFEMPECLLCRTHANTYNAYDGLSAVAHSVITVDILLYPGTLKSDVLSPA